MPEPADAGDATAATADIAATAATADAADDTASRDRQRLALEKKRERMVWYYLAYFLFGIHIVAFVMIYAVTHAK
ncbi:hypothetical protein GCM10011579_076110 [Streptomyces albiflavescens]|uniref:Uncharacterized protein n=1 Tax=Streptomyces albiflavescens TaxID=1623582 RepID=A0A917YBJ3_9ACTN|nr:hypothetical protein [Streptomyces albiflavescens]GGN85290.1 hypothetical protein GCM10011579_076110 [Streptomyces albiflavescens]